MSFTGQGSLWGSVLIVLIIGGMAFAGAFRHIATKGLVRKMHKVGKTPESRANREAFCRLDPTEQRRQARQALFPDAD